MRARAALALPLIVGLLGCPYQADTPLSATRDETDARLVGAWTCTSVSDPGDPPGTITFTGPKDGWYEAVVKAPDDDPDRMQTFVTTVGTQRILNVRDDSRKPVRWVFVRYAVEDARLSLEIAEEEAFEGKASARELIAAHEGKGGVFQPMLACNRKQ